VENAFFDISGRSASIREFNTRFRAINDPRQNRDIIPTAPRCCPFPARYRCLIEAAGDQEWTD
jgi:hypothetical protein